MYMQKNLDGEQLFITSRGCSFLKMDHNSPIFLGWACSSGAEARLLLPVCHSPRKSSALSDMLCRFIMCIYGSTQRSIWNRYQPQNNIPISAPDRQLYLKQPLRASVKGHNSSTSKRKHDRDKHKCNYAYLKKGKVYSIVITLLNTLVDWPVCTHYFVPSDRAAAGPEIQTPHCQLPIWHSDVNSKDADIPGVNAATAWTCSTTAKRNLKN